ncbi:MAG: translation initiation factor IF-3 [Deltaproteobacteria bacterium]|nr:translation initiation factor IF-3 [Deltaproteobacteria bacterium]
MSKELRINGEIRVPVVRVVGADGEPLGIMSVADANSRAIVAELDLVEVSPTAAPPVCRIMDYGKFRYQQSKRMQIAKKKQVVSQVKEIRLRPKTEDHDLQTKIKHIRRFLEQGDKVKITMIFRGREIAYTDLAMKAMEEIKEFLAEVASIEQVAKMEGRRMTMVVAPVAKKK